MEESQSRSLLIAAGIALGVLGLLAVARVELYRCTFTDDAKSSHSVSRGPGGGQLERNLRLWLDAGDLEDELARALTNALARERSPLTLKQEPTGSGQVTVRIDDASFYTPLYARAKLRASMTFEARADWGVGLPIAQGDSHVDVTGACYGVIAPSSFRDRVAQHLAKPLAEALSNALD